MLTHRGWLWPNPGETIPALLKKIPRKNKEPDPDQLKELDKAIKEADNKEAISWDDFKKEMKEWKKK